MVKKMGLQVKLNTNGLLPNRLKELIRYGLVDYVAQDYKNCKEHFAETVGLGRSKSKAIANSYYNNWRASLDCLRENHILYELRTTVVRELHPLNVLMQMAESIYKEENQNEPWFFQSFLKNRPIMCDYENQNIVFSAYSNEEMEEMKHRLQRIAPGTRLKVK
ncbi:MAG: hypothetical protein ACOYJC_05770 [Christensenellales bacterium]|jgi:pyruvate formate lyase activating enzyme